MQNELTLQMHDDGRGDEGEEEGEMDYLAYEVVDGLAVGLVERTAVRPMVGC